MISPLANPAWLAAIAAQVFHVPALPVLLAVAGGIALIARKLLVNRLLHALEQRAIIGFVQRRLPEDHARMVAIAPDHHAGIVNGALLKFAGPHELPTRI